VRHRDLAAQSGTTEIDSCGRVRNEVLLMV
jgi:hypothetical protein